MTFAEPIRFQQLTSHYRICKVVETNITKPA